MKNSLFRSIASCIIILTLVRCSQNEKLVIKHQVTGEGETNCYLLYDPMSKEAALIDVGGPIDTLIAHMQDENLKLKYIFATHCHLDHIDGVPVLRQKFPDARLCFNEQDFQDFIDTPAWAEENTDPKDLEEAMQNPIIKKWMEYDPAVLGKVDMYLEDDQIFHLGDIKIRTILAPGHSRGSICFYTGNVLFSGDVLFHERVGRTDFMGGSGEEIVKSVRRLYTLLPDETKVYPGHGQSTNIGHEKIENEEVAIDEVNLQN